ncbi:hypothetical protein V8E36_003856 [Tilletia maclaganii]
MADLELAERPQATDDASNAGLAELEEHKLPPLAHLAIVLSMNLMLNISFFIIIPSAPAYATTLGAPTWFSGLCIGISTAAAGMLLIPVSRRYKLAYKTPFMGSCVCFIMGNIIYAFAGVANTAWLMAVGRVVGGMGNVSWMLVKRYITDPRIVGTRRRTMLSAWLVTSQVLGMAIGPFSGGLLTKIGGFRRAGRIWNGFSSPSWLVAGLWAGFLVAVLLVFEDPPGSSPTTTLCDDLKRLTSRRRKSKADSVDLKMRVKDKVEYPEGVVQRQGYTSAQPQNDSIVSIPASRTVDAAATAPAIRLTPAQWASLGMMCWFAQSGWFTLGAWEANLPVFGADALGWTEEKAGNILALGAIVVLPMLFALVFLAKYIQDRVILSAGISIGLCGLIVHMVTLTPGLEHTINFGSYFFSWIMVALGYNMMSTVTLSLLSKQVPPELNNYTSVIIQLSNYCGRLGGAFWGTAVDQVGQRTILSLELAFTLIGALGTIVLWKKMSALKG